MSDVPREPSGREPPSASAEEGAGAAANAEAGGPSVCPICGGPLLGVHCKLICENCGYREDCSDLFA